MRTPSLHRPFISITLTLLVSLLLLVPPAHAQRTEPRCDPPVPPRDSLRLHPPPGYLLKIMAAFVVAPPALLRLPGIACEYPDDDELGMLRDHVSVFAGGGGLITGEWKGGPATSADAEIVVRGVYANVRAEQYWFGGDRIRLWDARAGYLFHPVRDLAGGVTVGYRNASGAPGDWGVEGVEIGLPIVFGACQEWGACWLLWEPTYVISRGHLRVSPRARLDVTIPRTPLVARLDIDSKGVRSENPFVVTLGLGVAAGRLRDR